MSTNRILGPMPAGLVIGSGDLQTMLEVALDQVGQTPSNYTGISSINSIGQPLTATTPGTNGVVTVAGVGQQCVIPNANGVPRVCQEITPFVIAVPVNTTGTVRIDLIYAQAIELAAAPAGGFSTPNYVQQPGVTPPGWVGPPVGGPFVPTFQTTYRQDVQFGYVQGVPGSGIAPSVPAGFIAVVQINVQPGGGFITQGNVVVLLPTFPVALLTGLQPLLPFVIVTGADPTGILDSSPAINTAVALALSTKIKRVMMAGGQYLCMSTLSYNGSTFNNLALEGAHANTTTLVAGTATMDLLDIANIVGFQLRNMRLAGFAGTSTAGYGINASNCITTTMDDVYVGGFFAGAIFSACTDLRWNNFAVQNSVQDGCYILNCLPPIKGVSCEFASNGANGMRITGPPPFSAGMGTLFVASRWVHNNTAGGSAVGLLLDTGITGVTAVGCQFGQQVGGSVDTQSYGVSLLGSNDYITLTSCPMRANILGGVNTVGTPGVNNRYRDCGGFNPQGVHTYPTIATGVQNLNIYGSDALLYINPNGATITTVTIGGVAWGNQTPSTPFTLFLGAGMQFALIFTGAVPIVTAAVT